MASVHSCDHNSDTNILSTVSSQKIIIAG